APGHFADQAALSAPVASHRAAITVVPLRPLRGKRPDLITAEAEVPRFGHQFYRRQHRVLANRGKKRTVAIEPVRAACQRGGEIEAEAVDMADLDPVAQ